MTQTETGYQYTVTSPAATDVQTITVTPDLATTTSTSAKVYTRTKYGIKVVITRATRTAKRTHHLRVRGAQRVTEASLELRSSSAVIRAAQ